MPSPSVESAASDWVVDGTTQSAHSELGEKTHTTGLVQAITLEFLQANPSCWEHATILVFPARL